MRLRISGAALQVPLLILGLAPAAPVRADCDVGNAWMQGVCRQLSETWIQGQDDLYLPFRAIHLPYAYSEKTINSLRETTWGLGYGRSRYDAAGDWNAWYGMLFLDSKSNLQPAVGYAHQWIWGPRQGLHAGLGYTVVLTARADYHSYTPIPGLLPIASINYGRASLNATFVPGGTGYGNVIFLWGRVGF